MTNHRILSFVAVTVIIFAVGIVLAQDKKFCVAGKITNGEVITESLNQQTGESTRTIVQTRTREDAHCADVEFVHGCSRTLTSPQFYQLTRTQYFDVNGNPSRDPVEQVIEEGSYYRCN